MKNQRTGLPPPRRRMDRERSVEVVARAKDVMLIGFLAGRQNSLFRFLVESVKLPPRKVVVDVMGWATYGVNQGQSVKLAEQH